MDAITKTKPAHAIPMEGFGLASRGSPRQAPPLATILLVDDDPLVRDVTSAMLEHHGYAVLEAACGRDALAVIERGEPVDMLLVDFQMPGMNGVAVAEAVTRARPDMPVLFLTGYGQAAELNGVKADSIVEKPVRDADLARRVRASLAA
ncbi:response regulator [Chthonobacter rhizosphaerae]|uniref:response regulator n=1 Tax=Chthonobacter rhizosphaerae TaxID=2735553 RepID=UPI0015EF1070|nr:response regulator [Chthonobacter rhizosphaerae]